MHSQLLVIANGTHGDLHDWRDKWFVSWWPVNYTVQVTFQIKKKINENSLERYCKIIIKYNGNNVNIPNYQNQFFHLYNVMTTTLKTDAVKKKPHNPHKLLFHRLDR